MASGGRRATVVVTPAALLVVSACSRPDAGTSAPAPASPPVSSASPAATGPTSSPSSSASVTPSAPGAPASVRFSALGDINSTAASDAVLRSIACRTGCPVPWAPTVASGTSTSLPPTPSCGS